MGKPVWLDLRKIQSCLAGFCIHQAPQCNFISFFQLEKCSFKQHVLVGGSIDFFHFVQLDSVILVVLLNRFFAFGNEPAALEAVSLFIEGNEFLPGI